MNHDNEHGLRVQLTAALLDCHALRARVTAAESERDALRADVRRLRGMLEKGTTRIRILLDRMQGCDAEVADGRRGQNGHELSLFEGEDWIGEQRAALAGGGESK